MIRASLVVTVCLNATFVAAHRVLCQGVAGTELRSGHVIPDLEAPAFAPQRLTSPVMVPTALLPMPAFVQLMYDRSTLPTRIVIAELSIRRNLQFELAKPTYGTILDLVIGLSSSRSTVLTMSTTIAANHGPDYLEVFRGKATLPWQPFGHNEWLPIKLSRPFVWDAKTAAQSLCVDWYCTASSQSFRGMWTSDWSKNDLGGFVAQNPVAKPDCWKWYGNTTAWSTVMHPGAPYKSTFQSSRLKSWPLLAILGFNGPGTKWGGRVLPIEFPVPGCVGNFSLYISPDIVYPVVTDANGVVDTIDVMDVPKSLVGKVIYQQLVWPELGAMMSTPVLASRVGTGKTPACRNIQVYGVVNPTTAHFISADYGLPGLGHAAMMKLN